ncbi:hypothetical protein H4I95_00818 [Botrytis cinerea]
MLLPSAFACGDSSQALSQPSRNHNLLFASPPLSPSPSLSPTPTISNLFQSCRALQSMLTTPTQLPSPPTLHAEIPSSPPPGTSHPRLRLRIPSTAKRVVPETGDRKRISKRTPREVSRGINKRRREMDDDMIYERMDGVSEQEHENSTLRAPSTPKRRRRIAPEVLPLGLERSDFHTLRLAEMENPEHEGAFVFSAGVIHSILRVKHEEVGRRKKMPRIGQGRKIECVLGLRKDISELESHVYLQALDALIGKGGGTLKWRSATVLGLEWAELHRSYG